MIKQIKLSLLCGFLIIGLFSTSIYAQTNLDNHLLFGKNHFTLNLSLVKNYLYEVPKIEGIGDFSLEPAAGMSMGLSYTMNPYRFLGIETGVAIGFQNYNYTIVANAADFGLSEPIHQTTKYPEPYLEFPLLFVPRLQVSNSDWFYAKAGIVMNFYIKSYYSIEINDPKDPILGENISGINLLFEANNPYFKGSFGFGWLRKTKSKNLLNFGLQANLGFNPVMEGEYRFRHPTKIASRGFFYSKGTYIALQVGYVFTGAKSTEQMMKKERNY